MDGRLTLEAFGFGEAYREDGSMPGPGIYKNLAFVLRHHSVDHREAEAGAFAFRLGGEERLKDVLQDLRGDARAGVRDFHHGVIPGF